jgi:hypothetical protein
MAWLLAFSRPARRMASHGVNRVNGGKVLCRFR